MYTDIVIPDGNEDKFVKFAEMLGYSSLCFLYEIEDFKKPMLKSSNLDIYHGVIVSEKDVSVLENTVNKFKEIEHDKNLTITGGEVDQMLTDAEEYLKNIKNIFEEISEERTKESIMNSYNELLSQIRTLPGFSDLSESGVFEKFRKEYVDTGRVPGFVSSSLENIWRAKNDYYGGKITVTEVNKVLKEIRNVLAEVKSYKNRDLSGEVEDKKMTMRTSDDRTFELFNYDEQFYLLDLSKEKLYYLNDDEEFELQDEIYNFSDPSKFSSFELKPQIIERIKSTLGADKIYF